MTGIRDLERTRRNVLVGGMDPTSAIDTVASMFESDREYLTERAGDLLVDIGRSYPEAQIAAVDELNGTLEFPPSDDVYSIAALEFATSRPRATAPLLDVLASSHQSDVEQVLLTLGRREPALVLPVRSEWMKELDEITYWTITTLAREEPAVLRRLIADAVLTIEADGAPPQDIETAVSVLGTVGRAYPEGLPHVTWFFELLGHSDPDVRCAAMWALTNVIGSGTELTVDDSRQTDCPEATLAGRTASELLDQLDGLLEEVPTDDGDRQNWENNCAEILRVIERIARERPDAVAARSGRLTEMLAHDELSGVPQVPAIVATCWRHSPRQWDGEFAESPLLDVEAENKQYRAKSIEALAAGGARSLEAAELDRIAARLGDESVTVRAQTVECLVDLGASRPDIRNEVVELLAWSVYDTESDVRHAAIGALGYTGAEWPLTAPTSFEYLCEALRTQPEDTRETIAALGAICRSYPGAPAALRRELATGFDDLHVGTDVIAWYESFTNDFPSVAIRDTERLVERAVTLTDENGEAAARAVFSIAEAQPRAVERQADRIERFLEKGSPSLEHRAHLAGALAALEFESEGESDAASWLVERVYTDPETVCPVLARLERSDPSIAEPVLEYARAALHGRRSRLPVLDAYGWVHPGGTEQNTPQFGSGVADAVEAFGTVRPAYGFPLLLELVAHLRSPSNRKRRRAVRAVSKLVSAWPHAGPLVQDAVLWQLDTADPESMLAAVDALAAIETTEADEALDQLTEYPRSDVRATARDAVEAHGPTTDPVVSANQATAKTVDTVAASLGSPDEDVRTRAIERLLEITRRQPEYQPRVINHLLLAVGASEQPRTATRILAALDDVAANRSDPVRKGESARQTPVEWDRLASILTGFFDHDVSVVRAQAITAAGSALTAAPTQIRDEVIGELGDDIANQDPFVRARAGTAIERLLQEQPNVPVDRIDQLEKALDGPAYVAPPLLQALEAIAVREPGSISIAPVASVLDSHPLHRCFGIRVLGAIGRVNDSRTVRVTELLLDALSEERTNAVPRYLIRAVERLPGSAIVDVDDGVETLFTVVKSEKYQRGPTKSAIRNDQLKTGVADRIRSAAQADPATVAAAVESVDTIPANPPDAARGLIETMELIVDDHPAAVRSVEDELWKHLKGFDGTTPVPHSVARVLARARSDVYVDVIESYGSGSPVASIEPDRTTEYLFAVDPEVRRGAIRAIVQHLPDDHLIAIADDVLDRSDSGDPHVRGVAIRLLATLAPRITDTNRLDRIVTTVRDGLDDEWDTKIRAVDGIAKLAGEHIQPAEEVLSALLDALSDEYPAVRERAADRIVTVSTDAFVDIESVVTTLDERIEHGPAVVRRGAAMALGSLATEEPGVRGSAVTTLRSMLDDDDRLARRRAAQALADISSVDPDAVAPARAELRRTIPDSDAGTQAAVIRCLGYVGTVSDCRRLRERPRDPSREVRSAITATRARLCPTLCAERATLLANWLQFRDEFESEATVGDTVERSEW